MAATLPKTVINAIALLLAHDLSEGVEVSEGGEVSEDVEAAAEGTTREGGLIEGIVSVIRVEARYNPTINQPRRRIDIFRRTTSRHTGRDESQ